MSKVEQLHYSLDPLNYQVIKAMVCKELIKGITLSKKELSVTPICAACANDKATRASFPTSRSGHADKILGHVHSDFWGPAPVQTTLAPATSSPSQTTSLVGYGSHA